MTCGVCSAVVLQNSRAMRTAMAIAALLPVVLISVSTENVGLIVAVTGSLFGALIQVGAIMLLL